MEVNTMIIAISIFIISSFLSWKILSNFSKKQLGKRMFKQWNSKLYLWQGVIFCGTGLTVLIIFLLKWTELLTI